MAPPICPCQGPVQNSQILFSPQYTLFQCPMKINIGGASHNKLLYIIIRATHGVPCTIYKMRVLWECDQNFEEQPRRPMQTTSHGLCEVGFGGDSCDRGNCKGDSVCMQKCFFLFLQGSVVCTAKGSTPSQMHTVTCSFCKTEEPKYP